MTSSTPLTIRPATAADDRALHRLAALDSSSVPTGPVVVAEVGGELHAAISLDGGVLVADPFRPTADIAATLRAHADRQASRRAHRTPRPRLRRHRLALGH